MSKTANAQGNKRGPGQTKGYVTTPGQSSTTRTEATQGSGTIVALMGITVLFALIGNEVKNLEGTPSEGNATVAGTVVTSGGKILIGGTVATALLALLTHAGNGGRQFAVGLALVSMTTATLVYGGPVWDALNKTFGSTPTTPVGTASSGTKPTTPVAA